MSDETPTIGQKLQEARSEKGLTIDDVQQATKIQRRYLIAIEDGQFDELPGDFYVRAFIKQYAQTVGLDGDELLRDYNDQLPQAAATNVMPVTEEQPATREPKTAKIGQESSGLDRLRSLLPIIIVSVIVVIILGTIWAFAVRSGRQSSNNSAVSSSHVAVSSSKTESASSHKSSSSTNRSSSSSSSSETTKANTKQTLVPVTTTGANATYRVENAPATNKLAITAKGADSWIQVTPTGGRALYVGTVTTGTNKELTLPAGTTGVSVSFGNRTATKVTINGKAVDLTKGTGTTGVLTLQLQSATSAAK
ncbi:helix-turn-helix domain-containing protein [Furfurilactobacillus curtus]|uniref:XRE family transcriptional regulator n=1 Tax=Furfurilactobacillus curtus TaxID=1746200 RepID=A0ABQ5JN17_9LACO